MPPSSPPKFPCSYCPATFRRKEHRDRHARTHTNTRSFVCPVCAYAMTRRDVLVRHMRYHEAQGTSGDSKDTRTSVPGGGSARAPGREKLLGGRRAETACDACAVMKVKCVGRRPCDRCQGLKIECTLARPLRRFGGRTVAGWVVDPEPKEGGDTGVGGDVPDPSLTQTGKQAQDEISLLQEPKGLNAEESDELTSHPTPSQLAQPAMASTILDTLTDAPLSGWPGIFSLARSLTSDATNTPLLPQPMLQSLHPLSPPTPSPSLISSAPSSIEQFTIDPLALQGTDFFSSRSARPSVPVSRESLVTNKKPKVDARGKGGGGFQWRVNVVPGRYAARVHARAMEAAQAAGEALEEETTGSREEVDAEEGEWAWLRELLTVDI